MSEKEPGQIAAEAWSGLGWEMLHESARERFARVETAVRNAALEEAARIAKVNKRHDGTYDPADGAYNHACDDIAAAIRSLKRT